MDLTNKRNETVNPFKTITNYDISTSKECCIPYVCIKKKNKP